MDAGTVWAGYRLEHDPLPTTSDDVASDIVLPPSRTTLTTATLMVRRRVRRALDIGTGCGALALLASRVADEVVAADVNRRALDITRRNAERNGVTNVSCIEGVLTEPFEAASFDLVVGNLPFVVSPPGSSLVFRDGTTGGRRQADRPPDICERALHGAAGVLAPGGIAQFLVNWIVTSTDRVFAEPRRWTDPTGCDAVVLLHSLQSADDYVRRWAVGRDDDRDAWLRYLRGIDAVAIANGAITLRRPVTTHPSGEDRRAPVLRTERMTAPPCGNGGSQIVRLLDAISPSDAESLAASSFTLVPHRGVGTGRAGLCRLVADDTCGVTALVRRPLDEVAGRFDHCGVDAAVASWARASGVAGRRDRQRMTALAPGLVRQLVMTGLGEFTSRSSAE